MPLLPNPEVDEIKDRSDGRGRPSLNWGGFVKNSCWYPISRHVKKGGDKLFIVEYSFNPFRVGEYKKTWKPMRFNICRRTP